MLRASLPLLVLLAVAGCEGAFGTGSPSASEPIAHPADQTAAGTNAAQDLDREHGAVRPYGQSPVVIIVTRDDPSLPSSCRPRQVAGLINDFFGAANGGETRISRFMPLPEEPGAQRGGADVVPEYTVTQNGDEFTARTRKELLAYFEKRHEQHERMELIMVDVATPVSSGRVDIGYYLTREADDLPKTGEKERVAAGKAVIDCDRRTIVRWVMHTIPPSEPPPEFSECPKPRGWSPGKAVIACVTKGST